MSEMQIFNNPEFGEIRTIMIDNEPWFVSVDVSNALGYTKTVNMTKLVDKEDRQNISSSILKEQGYRQAYTLGVINESGLYAAILARIDKLGWSIEEAFETPVRIKRR